MLAAESSSNSHRTRRDERDKHLAPLREPRSIRWEVFGGGASSTERQSQSRLKGRASGTLSTIGADADKIAIVNSLKENGVKSETNSAEGIQAAGGRRERQKRKTLARIVRAARVLFARKGFEATTTQEIAAKADIGTGTLFNYASTKEDLLLLVFREEMDDVVAEAFASIRKDGPLLDQLLHVFNSFVAYHKRDVAIVHALIRQLSSVNSPARRDDLNVFARGLMRRLSELVRDAQARGELRADVPRVLLAHNLFSVYYRLLQDWLGEYITHDQYAARIGPALELQLRGLRSDAAAASRPVARAGARR